MTTAPPRFSIVLPTHNRPDLLLEALHSLARQSFTDWEVIVVDDGSAPRIDEAELRAIVGDRLTLHRHARPEGVASARNRGYSLARGDFVAQLDDDDQLAPQALELADRGLKHAFAPDILYIGVEAFGTESVEVNPRQRATLERMLKHARPSFSDGLQLFGDTLFEALLGSVPAAFQHCVFRRSLLLTMSPMQSEHWPEAAWAIEAAARSVRCALLDLPLYRWRRDGQSYFSVSGQHHASMFGHIMMKQYLLRRLGDELPGRRTLLRQSLARARFDYCYDMVSDNAGMPWKEFMLSMRAGPGLKHLRLLYRRLTSL